LCHDRTATTFGKPADQAGSDELIVAAVQTRSRRRRNGEAEEQADRVGGDPDPDLGGQSITRHRAGPPNDLVLPWSLEGLRQAQRVDPDVGYIIEAMESDSGQPDWEAVALKSSDVKTLWKQWSRLGLRGGLLKRRFESSDGKSERWQVVGPKELRTEFLSIAHGGMTGGHLGLKKTSVAVQSRAYWPTWSTDLAAFIKRCPNCARYHRGAVPRRAEMQTPLVGEPWERVSVDITGPHPKSSRQNCYILTVVCHFSKWGEAIALPNHTAPVVARALVTHVFSRFGVPLQLLTDRGSEFESVLFAELMKWLEIDKIRTTAFHPSCNGVVERFHRTLNSMLAKIVSESQRDWDEKLPYVMAAYRASPHSSTGFSPNRLFLGRENRMPLDLVKGLPLEEVHSDATVDDFIVRQHELAESAYRVAREQLQAAAQRRKRAYDVRVKPEELTVGDWVWYHYPRRYSGRSPKWQKNYTGPYLVVREIPPVNYVLQRSPRSKTFVVHKDKLKKCHSPPCVSWLVPVGNADGEDDLKNGGESCLREAVEGQAD